MVNLFALHLPNLVLSQFPGETRVIGSGAAKYHYFQFFESQGFPRLLVFGWGWWVTSEPETTGRLTGVSPLASRSLDKHLRDREVFLFSKPEAGVFFCCSIQLKRSFREVFQMP